MLQEYTWKVHTLAAFACTVYEISPGCAVVRTEASAAGAVGGVVAPANWRRRGEQRPSHRSRRARATPRATGAAATKMRAAATAACSSSSSGPASLSLPLRMTASAAATAAAAVAAASSAGRSRHSPSLRRHSRPKPHRGHRRHIPRRSRSRVFAGTSQRRHRSPRATMGARTAEPRAAAATAVAAASSAGRNRHSPSRSRRNNRKPLRGHRRHSPRRSRIRVVAGTSQRRHRPAAATVAPAGGS